MKQVLATTVPATNATARLCFVAARVLTMAALWSAGMHGAAAAAEPSGLRPRVVATFDQVPVGVAVSHKGRIFVTLPYSDYSSDPHGPSVVEVLQDGTKTPFPDTTWNAEPAAGIRDPGRSFLNVQSATIDAGDHLWIGDTGSPRRAGVVPGGAKLVEIDLSTNTVTRTVPFDAAVLSGTSFLNDIRVDAARHVVYGTETGSGSGGLIVTDLATGQSRRIPTSALPLRSDHTAPTRFMNGDAAPDGIALDAAGRFLYLHTTTGPNLYRIDTEFLRSAGNDALAVGAHMERVGATESCDDMEMDAAGWLYLSDFARQAVTRYRPGGTVEVMTEHVGFPSGMGVGPGGHLFFTDAQFPKLALFNHGVDAIERPFKLYDLTLSSK